jgi:hypothetical protein
MTRVDVWDLPAEPRTQPELDRDTRRLIVGLCVQARSLAQNPAIRRRARQDCEALDRQAARVQAQLRSG